MRRVAVVALGCVLGAGSAHAALDASVCQRLEALNPGFAVSVSMPGKRFTCPAHKGQPKMSLKVTRTVASNEDLFQALKDESE